MDQFLETRLRIARGELKAEYTEGVESIVVTDPEGVDVYSTAIFQEDIRYMIDHPFRSTFVSLLYWMKHPKQMLEIQRGYTVEKVGTTHS
ncbi:hypothetical protein ACFL96_07520 [Thermoproteota archaeon]